MRSTSFLITSDIIKNSKYIMMYYYMSPFFIFVLKAFGVSTTTAKLFTDLKSSILVFSINVLRHQALFCYRIYRQ